MKISPKFYAKAFVDLLRERKFVDGEIVAQKLARVVIKNGDIRKKEKIIAYAEKYLRESKGKHLLSIESARRLPQILQDGLLKVFNKREYDIRHIINADLIAGTRFTIDEEKQFDLSFRKILKTIFRNYN